MNPLDNPVKEELEMIQQAYNVVVDFLINYSFQVVGAIVILIIGFFVSRFISNAVLRACERKEVDVTLRLFLSSVVRILVLVCFVIISLGKFGITIAPFVAAIGAIAFGAGFAIQGPVSNYGAGFAIILSRPFVVGNTITVREVSGQVKEVKLAATILETADGEEITIPNKHIIGEILQNSFENKLVETIVGIDYGDSPEEAVNIIRGVLENLSDVVQEPSPQIGIDGFGESSIDIGVRFWVPTKTYYQSKYAANGAIFKALLEHNITIPFPKRDVTLINGQSSQAPSSS